MKPNEKQTEPMQNENYGRNIDPGEGFEILPLTAIPKKGDEFTQNGINWSVINVDYKNSIHEHVKECSTVRAFRRKATCKQPVPKTGWIDINQQMPTESDYPIFVQSGEKVGIADLRYQKNVICPEGWPNTNVWDLFTDSKIFQWQRIKLPEPTPIKSPADLAFEKSFEVLQSKMVLSDESKPIFREVFEAGRQFEQGNK